MARAREDHAESRHSRHRKPVRFAIGFLETGQTNKCATFAPKRPVKPARPRRRSLGAQFGDAYERATTMSSDIDEIRLEEAQQDYWDALQIEHARKLAWRGVMHELGHALGLKHPQETDIENHQTTHDTVVPIERDSIEFTLMSYHSYVGGPENMTYEEWGASQTLMMYDIAALQEMYGADGAMTPQAPRVPWGNVL